MKYNITYIQDAEASKELCHRVVDEIVEKYSDIAREGPQEQIAIAMAMYMSAQNCMGGFLKIYGTKEILSEVDVAFNKFLDKIKESLEQVVKMQTAFKDN